MRKIGLLLIILLASFISGCSNSEQTALSVGKQFHELIKNKEYKAAYQLQIKRLTDEEIEYYYWYGLEDNDLTFKKFETVLKQFQSYFEKEIEKIEVHDTKEKNIKTIDFKLPNSQVIILHVKRVGGNYGIGETWRILIPEVLTP